MIGPASFSAGVHCALRAVPAQGTVRRVFENVLQIIDLQLKKSVDSGIETANSSPDFWCVSTRNIIEAD